MDIVDNGVPFNGIAQEHTLILAILGDVADTVFDGIGAGTNTNLLALYKNFAALGSIDFRAAARSVLLIGRVKREPNVRVIVHDKSSLAPEGKPVAFCLDPETGFSWIGEYDITADELLSGAGGNTATKTEQAERLILDLLADGKELASEDIEKAATEAGISARTVRAAKRNLDGRITSKRIGAAWYHALKK